MSSSQYWIIRANLGDEFYDRGMAEQARETMDDVVRKWCTVNKLPVSTSTHMHTTDITDAQDIEDHEMYGDPDDLTKHDVFVLVEVEEGSMTETQLRDHYRGVLKDKPACYLNEFSFWIFETLTEAEYTDLLHSCECM
jgi:hypothetical protein